MKIRRLVTIALLAAMSLGALAASPKREFRSIWMAAMGIDWPTNEGGGVGLGPSYEAKAKAELIQYLDNFKQHNFNGVCVHVRPLADAYYKSTLEPWSASLTGVRGQDPGWDPLAFAVEECHKRGLECYAWINPFRIDKEGNTLTTPFDLEWRKKGWELKSGNWTIFNPAIPEARQHCLDVIREIYTNYDIDGFLFDDYFYPGDQISKGPSAGDYKMWEDAHSGMSLGDWRRNNVNTFVKELYDMLQSERPEMRFGIGPAGVAGASAYKYKLDPPRVGNDWMYDGIYCDPLAWLNDGTIDFIAPQIYWSRDDNTAAYGPLCEWWSDIAEHFGRHNYVSIAAYKVASHFGGNTATGGWAEIGAQVQMCRDMTRNNASGQIYYSAKYFDGPALSGMGNYLEHNSYQSRALVPVVDWKDRVVYAAPANPKFDGNTLTWDPTVPAKKAIIRYTVYAIPFTHSLQQAMAEDGDGISAEFLEDVSYSTTFTLPENKRRGYWYAVCVYDGYGYESEPAVFNYSGEMSATPVLTAPADGAEAVWDQTFSWEPIKNAVYYVEVSANADFSNILFKSEGIEEAHVTYDLSHLGSGTPCYWRVMASEPTKLFAASEVRRFTSPVRRTGQQARLLTPAEGTEVSGSEVTFSWEPVPDATSYFVIVAHDDDFDHPLYTTEVEGITSFTVPRSVLGHGSHGWRVVAKGNRINESVSETGLFTAVRPEAGSTENGYTVATDPAAYDNFGELTVESLWTRKFAAEDDGSVRSGMVATRDYVYLTGRRGNEATSRAFLSQYDAATGEHVRDIELAPEASVSNLPCNDLVRDSEGNIFIVNATTNAQLRPLLLMSVNMATGAVETAAELKGVGRAMTNIDHVAVYGDVINGTFTAYAPISGKALIARWVFEGGEQISCETASMKEFAPASARNFGDSPRVVAVDGTHCYVDGGNTVPTLYDWENARVVTSLAQAPGMASAATADNGLCLFSMNGHHYAVFNTGAAATGSRFTVGHLPEEHGFANLSVMWTLPQSAMGTNDNAEGSSPADVYVAPDGKSAVLYVYSPGNGLAAYAVSDLSGGIGDVTADSSLSYTIDGLTLHFANVCDVVKVYNTAGIQVAAGTRTDEISVAAAGTYMVVADGHAIKVLLK